MYYFLIQATPRPDSEEAKEASGAYVNCWINFPLKGGAELLARHYIRKYGWKPGKMDVAFWVEEGDYEDHPEALERYREAAASTHRAAASTTMTSSFRQLSIAL
jgi:hypothetical protein